MIGRIQKAMRAPMAAPPGRQRFLNRHAPEVCAVLVYVVVIVTAFFLRDEEHPLLAGALAGYGLAWLLMVVGPVGTAAQCLVFEYEGGTAEALVLTSMDHARLAVGRYWHAALPWLRFMVWLIPIYASHVVNGGIDAHRTRDFLTQSGLFAIGPRPIFIAFMAEGIGRDGMHPCWTISLTAARFCVDAVAVLLAAAIAFDLSARMRRNWAAAVVGHAMVLGLFCTVFLAAEWTIVLTRILIELGGALTGWDMTVRAGLQRALIALYFVAKVLMVGFEVWIARWLVLRVARNFDAYMLGERPDGRSGFVARLRGRA